MGKILLRLLALVALFCAILVGIGYCLPRSYTIETSIHIEAPPEDVFLMLDSLPNWQHWSTWNSERIEGLKITYGEKSSGVGGVQTWSDARGNGKLWITESQRPKRLEYKMKFGEFPEMDSTMELTPKQGGTNLTWSSKGELPSGAFYGYTAMLFPAQMTYEYDQSLQRLKKSVEKK